MIDITVSTPGGELYNSTVDYLVVKNDDGEFAILKDHIAVITSIEAGYVKLVTEGQNQFFVLVNGLLEFNKNVCNVIAQEATIGDDYDHAVEHLAEVRRKRAEENRRKNVTFVEAEQELKKQVKSAKAGNL